MPRREVARIQDSVHGLMDFRGLEMIVLDVLRTPELQRLKRIRQLGLAHYVYPGAEHSRLAHSLGSSYLAILFGRHLEGVVRNWLSDTFWPDEYAIRDFALSALCHDLGHGPLSHVWERAIVGGDYNREDWIKSLQLEDDEQLKAMKWHELVTQGLLAWEEGQLNQLLESSERGLSDRIRDFLKGRYYLSYLPALISSDIDIDRADFLIRDSHQCGLRYGKHDINWLISTCLVGVDDRGELVVGFDQRKAIRVTEQFLIARRALYETVYFHKTVRAAECMVESFLERLKTIFEDGYVAQKTQIENFVKPMANMISGLPLSASELLSLDDYALWVLIDNIHKMENMDPTAKDLAKRILLRDLFKEVPRSSEAVSKFLRQDDSADKLTAAVKVHVGIKEPRYYWRRDESSFQMFADPRREKDEIGYFIDENGGYKASPFWEHPKMEHIYPGRERNKQVNVRLFTIKEAIDDVVKLIDKK